MNDRPSCTVIIVTHNSEKVIDKAINCLQQQTYAVESVIVVDSGSENPAYLQQFHQYSNVNITVMGKDVGFCKGNNIGMSKLPSPCDYVFFLNPDAFLTPTYISEAIEFMENPKNTAVGAMTGTILGYDLRAGKPSGNYDTTGVFSTWYGRWYDRAQGESFNCKKFQLTEQVPAICGAAMFCRKKALESVMMREREVFDNRFYMYKEDIDLSIRLRKKGWTIAFVPYLTAYHCRGWQRNRAKMARKFRLASAWNELKIHVRMQAPIPIVYSLCKFMAVKIFDM